MTLGEPASCRAARGVPYDIHPAVSTPGHLAGGAAARQIRLASRSQSAPPGEDPGAEGRVQLVPGESDPVDVQSGDVHRVVRGELRGVQHDACAVRVGGGGQLGHRPQFTGDVRCAGHAHQGRAVGLAGRQCALQGLTACCGLRGASR